MPFNTAAWLTAARVPLAVKPAPYTPPGADEIVVKNHAVAINPFDWVIQAAGDFIFAYIKYPFILGSDLAGEVVAVGAAVTRFKVGDRVLGHAVGADPTQLKAAGGAFQTYTVVLERMASPIPDSLSYACAAVLPLGLSTAACGLFQKDFLALDYPSASPKPTGKTVLVWGGSTSVGANAIQLAVAAGYEVMTTASPRNFDYVKRLGASQAFDYRSKTVIKDLIQALKGKTIAGAIAIGGGSAQACLKIVQASKGDKFVALATPPISFKDMRAGPLARLRFLAKVPKFLSFNLLFALQSRLAGVRTKFIFGSSLLGNEVCKVIYADFLPQALASGRYVAAPEPEVAGHSLADLQAGLDLQRKGLSARKVVIALMS